MTDDEGCKNMMAWALRSRRINQELFDWWQKKTGNPNKLPEESYLEYVVRVLFNDSNAP